MTLNRRLRELETPEGLSLPLTVASRGARVGALLLDLVVIYGSLIVIVVLFAWLGLGVIGIQEANPVVEALVVLVLITVFLARFGYFLAFELGPRGATPGKRALGIRVAARDGGRLTPEAVIARNLIRDVEVWIPLVFVFTGGLGMGGAVAAGAGLWFLVFACFPFFNRDAMRAGDLVAGTFVVEADRRKLLPALSVAPPAAAAASEGYRFGEAELSVYGERELQVLESVLRQANPEAMREVMEAICRKIGWEPGRGDEQAFLEAFYSALRARLERDMRFGKRKKDKFDR